MLGAQLLSLQPNATLKSAKVDLCWFLHTSNMKNKHSARQLAALCKRQLNYSESIILHEQLLPLLVLEALMFNLLSMVQIIMISTGLWIT